MAEGAQRIPGETPRLEAEVLLAHILERSRTWILAHPEIPLTLDQKSEFFVALERLTSGEPLAYITGHREFLGLDFVVNRNVLVPRPETELLVEEALRFALHAPRPTPHAPRPRLHPPPVTIADIGTGSGCIAVALAAHLPEARLIAADVSDEALAVARTNAARHGVSDRIEFRLGSLLEPLFAPVDLICANLPYVDSTQLSALAVSKHEPRLALDGGNGGLSLIERLLADAPRCLNPGGAVLLEIGATQGEAATTLARAAFPSANVAVHKDLAGLGRILELGLPGPR